VFNCFVSVVSPDEAHQVLELIRDVVGYIVTNRNVDDQVARAKGFLPFDSDSLAIAPGRIRYLGNLSRFKTDKVPMALVCTLPTVWWEIFRVLGRPGTAFIQRRMLEPFTIPTTENDLVGLSSAATASTSIGITSGSENAKSASPVLIVLGKCPEQLSDVYVAEQLVPPLSVTATLLGYAS